MNFPTLYKKEGEEVISWEISTENNAIYRSDSETILVRDLTTEKNLHLQAEMNAKEIWGKKIKDGWRSGLYQEEQNLNGVQTIPPKKKRSKKKVEP